MKLHLGLHSRQWAVAHILAPRAKAHILAALLRKPGVVMPNCTTSTNPSPSECIFGGVSGSCSISGSWFLWQRDPLGECNIRFARKILSHCDHAVLGFNMKRERERERERPIYTMSWNLHLHIHTYVIPSNSFPTSQTTSGPLRVRRPLSAPVPSPDSVRPLPPRPGRSKHPRTPGTGGFY